MGRKTSEENKAYMKAWHAANKEHDLQYRAENRTQILKAQTRYNNKIRHPERVTKTELLIEERNQFLNIKE